MRFHARTAVVSSFADLLNMTGTSLTSSKSGATVHLGLMFTYLQRGDRLRIDYVGPGNRVEFSTNRQVDGRRVFGLYGWWPNFHLGMVGNWKIRVHRNDVLMREVSWRVTQ